MIENLTEITPEDLLDETHEMMDNGFRFITASCVETGNGTFDVIYHFGKDYGMKHFRVKIQKGQELPSISNIYFCSILVENEIKELFGVSIKGIAIDYGGHMLLSEGSKDAPMCSRQITEGGGTRCLRR